MVGLILSATVAAALGLKAGLTCPAWRTVPYSIDRHALQERHSRKSGPFWDWPASAPCQRPWHCHIFKDLFRHLLQNP